MKYIFGTVIAFVAVVIVAGVYFAGSPTAQRQKKLDDLRISHLSSIQYNITEYWRAKQKLPDTLSELNNDLMGIRVQTDPETQKTYEYEKRGETSFALCANFSTKSDPDENAYPQGYYPSYSFDGIRGGSPWTHEIGRVCFERTIDKDFFKPIPPIQ